MPGEKRPILEDGAQARSISASIVGGNLKVEAEVDVTQDGSYALEAWLIDGAGNLIQWSRSQPVSLTIGLQTLSLSFDGSIIRSASANGPYHIVALKVLAGDQEYAVLDDVDVALTTDNYEWTDFNEPDTWVVFQDAMDGDEVHLHGTDPLDPGTDDDGNTDREEIDFGTDPLDPNSRIRKVFLPFVKR